MIFGYKKDSSNTMTLDTKGENSSKMAFGHKEDKSNIIMFGHKEDNCSTKTSKMTLALDEEII
jgi:hypothetical protein